MKKFGFILACSLLIQPLRTDAQSCCQNAEKENATTTIVTSGSNRSSSLFGDYKGKLNVGMASLNIVLHITKDKTVTLDSPDQGAYGIPSTVCYLSADSVNVRIDALKAEYAGKFKDGRLVGKYMQAGYTFDLDMIPGTVVQNRPQTPVPPYAYKTEEVMFLNGDATLCGTLTYPENYKKGCPVVLLVSGSGQQNRDEEIFGHKPFLVLADCLAKHGIASLRYDDRGTGKSTGDISRLTTFVNMQDALSGIEYLRQTKAFGKVGVIGHSEGGTIAYMLAARKKIDFLVAMAGPAMAGDSLLIMQNRDLLSASGLDNTTVQSYCCALKKIFDYKKSLFAENGNGFVTMTDTTTQTEFFYKLIKEFQLPNTLKENLKEVFNMKDSWYCSFLALDPTDDVCKTSCPVMAIGGSKDLQVMASDNLNYTRKYLPKSSKNLFKEYDGLNHLFQPCKQGTVTEYGQIETTISSDVLTDIVNWINKL